MSKHSVQAGDIAGLLRRFAQLKDKARARTADYRHPGGRSGRLLDSPGAASVRRSRQTRQRSSSCGVGALVNEHTRGSPRLWAIRVASTR